MALPLIQAVNIQPGMRVLEGPEPAKLPLSWQNTGTVVSLELWEDLHAIHEYASEPGVCESSSGTCR